MDFFLLALQGSLAARVFQVLALFFLENGWIFFCWPLVARVLQVGLVFFIKDFFNKKWMHSFKKAFNRKKKRPPKVREPNGSKFANITISSQYFGSLIKTRGTPIIISILIKLI